MKMIINLKWIMFTVLVWIGALIMAYRNPNGIAAIPLVLIPLNRTWDGDKIE